MVKDGRLDGWRIDVANMTGRLRDQDLNAEVARHTRDALTQAAPDALLVAEHAHDYTTDARGDGWHGVMNYAGFTKPVWSWLRDEQHAPSFLGAPLRVPRLDASAVAATMRDFAAHVPWRTVVTSFNLLGSHDTTRIHTVVGGDHAKAEIAAALLFTLPGIPMLTYGDEIGMEGEFGEDGRRPFPWTGKEDTHPLRHVYRALIELRRKSAALRTGGLRWIHAEGDALVYIRETADERILVHCARSAHDPLVIDATELQADASQPLYGAAPYLANGQLTISTSGPQVGITRLL
jgi:alpha-glucosidase